MNQRLVLLCFVMLLGLSCNKAGVGGKASISGVVKHDQVPITSATVYIKYGADAFPGFELDQYDDQTTASAIDASFSFTNLHRGEYFIYCAGKLIIINNCFRCFCPILLSICSRFKYFSN